MRQYDMTAHATEEMAEDKLEIADIEHAVFTGRVARIGVVGRFAVSDRYLIITVYKIIAV